MRFGWVLVLCMACTGGMAVTGPAPDSTGYDAGVVPTPTVDGGMTTTPPPGCTAEGCQCVSAASCDDANPCTLDSCNGTMCTHTAIAGCCVDAASCDDFNACTIDSCGPTGCEHQAIAGCNDPSNPTPTPMPTSACFQPRPAGAAAPPQPRGYSAGTCPTLSVGPNTINTAGGARVFHLALPDGYDGSTQLPLIVYWHEIYGDAGDILRRPEAQTNINSGQTIVVSMQSKGDVTFTWPFTITDSDARINQEVTFFDDVLSCVAQQYSVNLDCVSSIGVSAGALWNAQLVQRRSEHLSSFISLSGGVGGVIRPWASPARRAPGLVLWGGPSDVLGPVNFHQGSQALLSGMSGHYAIECIHNCGHGAPPDAVASIGFLWQFVAEHPYWMTPGQGAWATLPAGSPSWCGVGRGSATTRSGGC